MIAIVQICFYNTQNSTGYGHELTKTHKPRWCSALQQFCNRHMTKMTFVWQTYVESSNLPKQHTCGKQHSLTNFLRYYKKNMDMCAHIRTNF